MAEPTLDALRRIIARVAHPPARRPAADVGRHLRLSRLRHGPPDGGARAAQARSARLPRRDPDPPDRRSSSSTRSRTRSPSSRRSGRVRGVTADSGPCPRRRPPDRGGRRARHAARQVGRRRPRSTSTCRSSPTRRASAISTWCAGRRSTSPPATSSRSCCRSASRRPSTLPPFALYRALRRVNPSPYLYYLDFGGFARRRLQPGDPGPRTRRRGHHPPDRRHPAARRARRRRTRRSRPSSSPTRRSAPST